MNSVTGRLFYVPTNRLCVASLSSYVEEAAHLQKLQSAPVTFALIENDRMASDEHSAVMAEASATLTLPTIHFTALRCRAFAAALVANAQLDSEEASKVLALLTQPPHAYSAGPNMAALLAAAIGADTLHRRDSDTMPLLYEGRVLYPSELEALYIGKPLSAFVQEKGGLASPDGDAPILYVASDYDGDPPVDILELAELSLDLALDYEQLKHPHATRESLQTRWREYYRDRTAIKYTSDTVAIDTTGLTEVGVSCCHRLFLDLPEMPIRETLGCDYFQKNLLYRLGWPVLYHNRRVAHRYSGDRNTRDNDDAFLRYNLSAARYLVLRRIWLVHNRQLEARRVALLQADRESLINSATYAQSLAEAQEAVSKDEMLHIVEGLATIYARAFELSPERTKFARIADTMLREKWRLVDDVAAGVHDYLFLIRNWSRLVLAARRTGLNAA
jgi:hypothetical protein